MRIYTVKINSQYENQLTFVSQLDPDAVIEFEDATTETETYTVTTARDIDTLLDQQRGVIYDVTEE